jgi:hypothetical protein
MTKEREMDSYMSLNVLLSWHKFGSSDLSLRYGGPTSGFEQPYVDEWRGQCPFQATFSVQMLMSV